jgi:hypothetical protein
MMLMLIRALVRCERAQPNFCTATHWRRQQTVVDTSSIINPGTWFQALIAAGIIIQPLQHKEHHIAHVVSFMLYPSAAWLWVCTTVGLHAPCYSPVILL